MTDPAWPTSRTRPDPPPSRSADSASLPPHAVERSVGRAAQIALPDLTASGPRCAANLGPLQCIRDLDHEPGCVFVAEEYGPGEPSDEDE